VTDTTAYLRETREKRGLTLDDVQQETRIPRHYLEMMEGEGDTRLISDPLYLVHYIRLYAEHLQLEGTEQLAAQFIRENTRLQGSKRSRPPRKAEKSPPVLPWLFLILVVLGAGAAYIFDPNLLSRTVDEGTEETTVVTTTPVPDEALTSTPAENLRPTENASNDTSKQAITVLQPEAEGIIDTATQTEKATATSTDSTISVVAGDTTPAVPTESASVGTPKEGAEPAPASTTAKPAEGEADGQRLEIVAKEKAWIRVIVDGQSPQDMMMAPGDSRAWSADKQFVLTLGNAGGVDLTLNGKKLAPLGASGQVVRSYQLPR